MKVKVAQTWYLSYRKYPRRSLPIHRVTEEGTLLCNGKHVMNDIYWNVWEDDVSAIDCKRCLKKMEKMNKKNPQTPR